MTSPVTRRARPVHALAASPGPTVLAWRLRPERIRAAVPPRRPGSYVLLHPDGGPVYVGRSDTCLRSRLSTHPHRGRATHFAAAVTDGPRSAWLAEAYWWHRLIADGHALLNRVHPSPARRRTPCPFCAISAPRPPAAP